MASIQQRPQRDGSVKYRVGYRITRTVEGQPKRVLEWTHTVDNPEGAVAMQELIERLGPELALATINQRKGRDVVTGPPLLADWFERHLGHLEADATSGTIADYRRMAERTWLPRLGPLPLDAITRETVVEWVAWQRKQETHRSRLARERAEKHNETCAARDMVPVPERQTYSPKSIRNAHGLLSSVLAAAMEPEYLARNVAKGVRLPKDEQEREMEIFTEAQWVTFFSTFQEHYQTFVLFLIGTSTRIGEATAVQARDFDLDAVAVLPDGSTTPMPTVHIRRAWKKAAKGVYLGAPKSRRSKRPIVIATGLADMIRPMLEGLAPDDFVFTAVQGGRISAGRFRERQWGKAMKRAGITKHLTPHSLRHTSASWLLTEGVAPQIVQHRLGHESLATTSKVYAHLLTDAQLVAAHSSQRALAGSMPLIDA